MDIALIGTAFILIGYLLCYFKEKRKKCFIEICSVGEKIFRYFSYTFSNSFLFERDTRTI